jgi:hypothetical protein
VDPLWPKRCRIIGCSGETIGVSVDAQDHIWIIHRAGSLEAGQATCDDHASARQCCAPAHRCSRYDQAGNLLRHWGGPGQGYNCPDSNHGITIDYKGNVWIRRQRARPGSGRRPGPEPLPKATRGPNGRRVSVFRRQHGSEIPQDGKFLMQIGKPSSSKGSSDIDNLRLP